MSNVYLSESAPQYLADYLISNGHSVVRVRRTQFVMPQICDHPDVYMCRLGSSKKAPLVRAELNRLGWEYPADVAYCALCTDSLFIHRLSATAPELRRAAEQEGKRLVDVRQGYAKCSSVQLCGDAVITADVGIYRAVTLNGGDALLISPGNVSLPGFDTGFIGGASGLVGDEVIFCGDLTRHPDFERIADFISSHGLTARWFEGHPLLDIGTVIESDY